MSNEELFRVHQIFKTQLKVETIETRVPSNAQVYFDDFLITADKNPNTRGAELLATEGGGSDALLRGCAEGRIHFLYICHHDLTTGFDAERVRAALGKVDFVVFQGSWAQPTSAMAHVQLPDAAYAEKSGTFTNIQGRVQRINAAVPPLGLSLPGIEIFARIARELEMPHTASVPEAIFEEIGRRVESFAGMTYESVGGGGQLIT
jgi:predicted molibdopterin-dependent oxidoreductase YjgC